MSSKPIHWTNQKQKEIFDRMNNNIQYINQLSNPHDNIHEIMFLSVTRLKERQDEGYAIHYCSLWKRALQLAEVSVNASNANHYFAELNQREFRDAVHEFMLYADDKYWALGKEERLFVHSLFCISVLKEIKNDMQKAYEANTGDDEVADEYPGLDFLVSAEENPDNPVLGL